MPPLPSDKISDVGNPPAGHAGSEACGEVVRPGGVCGCGTTRVRLPTVGVLRGENQAFSPRQPLRSRYPPRRSEMPMISDAVGISSIHGGEDVNFIGRP